MHGLTQGVKHMEYNKGNTWVLQVYDTCSTRMG